VTVNWSTVFSAAAKAVMLLIMVLFHLHGGVIFMGTIAYKKANPRLSHVIESCNVEYWSVVKRHPTFNHHSSIPILHHSEIN